MISCNKKGTDKMLSIYWFAILLIVAIVIVYMAALFYGHPYDVREVEANFLTNKVSECIFENGMIKTSLLSEDVDFETLCKLNFETENQYNWNRDQYYINIKVCDIQTGNCFIDKQVGNLAFESFCSSRHNTDPYCVNRRVYGINNNGDQLEVSISGLVRKTEKNVKL